MKRKWRHWAICIALAIVGAGSARLLSNSNFFQLLNLKLSDAQFSLRGRLATPHVLLITADQKALNTFKDELRMFWHSYYAEAIRAAGEGGARVIGLDATFGIPVEKWTPGQNLDQKIAEAVASSPVPVVCAYVEELNENPEARQVPLNLLTAGLGLAAYANLTVDSADQFVRRQELLEAPSRNPADPPPARSMGMLLAEKYLGKEAKFDGQSLTLNGDTIPISDQRAITINYAGPAETIPHVSLADFIAAARAGHKEQIRDWVKDKAVLIGLDTRFDDSYPTPFVTLLDSNRWYTAGVEIHANTLLTILEHRYLLPVEEGWRICALLLVALVTVWVVTTMRTSVTIGLLFLELALILIGTQALFRSGWILYTAELMIAALICLLAAELYRFSTAEKGRELFRRAVSVFVGKQLTTTLESTEAIGLTGKNLCVTILFTDIRGFTAFTEKVCEEEGPEQVVILLNDYMAQMVAIIVKYQGSVNKFIGDGILAIFSDDDEGCVSGDHAIRCVRCATEIVQSPSRFSTGAGIHTGAAVVGNVGSKDKMEYTVLGDTVNLASRLESLNKEHHTKLLMSEATQETLHGQVDTTHLAAVPVRGKAAPINLYTVTELVPAPLQETASVQKAIT